LIPSLMEKQHRAAPSLTNRSLALGKTLVRKILSYSQTTSIWNCIRLWLNLESKYNMLVANQDSWG
jgi:hypothetical protein